MSQDIFLLETSLESHLVNYNQRRTIGNQFSRVENSGIRAVFISACKTGRSKELASAITKEGNIKFVIGYFNITTDHFATLAEQLSYYQVLLWPKLAIDKAVRRVNEALYALGTPEERLLSCWQRISTNELRGPSPWWGGDNASSKEPEARSFLAMINKTLPKRGRVGDETAKNIRKLVKKLR